MWPPISPVNVPILFTTLDNLIAFQPEPVNGEDNTLKKRPLVQTGAIMTNVGKINMFGLSVRQINAEVLAQVIALGVLIADVLAGDNHLLSLLRLGLEPEAADPMV